MALKKITVLIEGGKHVCDPAETAVKPNDLVEWVFKAPATAKLLIFFPTRSPFREGRGPFAENERVTVKSIPPLKSGDRFRPKIAVRGIGRATVGDIIVKDK